MARLSGSVVAAIVTAAVVVSATPVHAAIPPATPTAFTARPGDRQVALRWANPSDADFAGVTVQRANGTEWLTIYAGTGTSAVATGLSNGTTYTFAVLARNTEGESSERALVTATPLPPVATRLTASLTPGVVTYGQGVTISALLWRTDTNEPLSGAPVDFYRKAAGESSFTKLGRLHTDAAGAVTYRPSPPPVSMQWYLHHPADPYFGESTSSPMTSNVRARLTIRVSRAVVEQNMPSVISVGVAPNHAGQPVYLQQYVNSAWRNVTTRALSNSSTASFSFASPTLGKRVFRIAKGADADHVGVATTAFAVTVVRRTLRSGMSGSDVLDVERRLAAARYDPGKVDGYYDYDTFHAAATFQKVHRMTVTGAVDATTYARLLRPATPVLRYAQASGSWVEIDLTRQVLYYGRDGRVLRILDVSSGSGRYFTVEGQTQRAVTPTGSFRIFHKINGLRTSRLGELWRPAYFASGGYAIHGNGSVPFYPASHGCVRITNSAMNRLFDMLAIGMRVHVYRT